MPTTKSGEKISWNEFGTRWKDGINKVTPLQQSMSTLWGNFIVIFGIVWGIIISIIVKQWWLLIILSGSLIISFTNIIGQLQKYFQLKRIDEMMKGGLNKNE